jgi:hypothetical protein
MDGEEIVAEILLLTIGRRGGDEGMEEEVTEL